MKSLAELMAPMAREVAQRSGSAASLAPFWSAAVGEVLARHTRPVRLERGVLTVRCSTAAWCEALAGEHDALVRKLRAAVGAGLVQRIAFELE